MKLNLKCPKCGSENVELAAETGNPLPMYKCNDCGYTKNLFPDMQDKE